MVMANVQIGAFGLGINGFFLPNSSSTPSSVHGFWISQKPFFRIALSSIAVQKSSRVFYGRKPNFCTVSALADGEIEAHSANTRLLEKEFKFSPTFNDYVKVMESVITDRSKNLSADVDADSPKKRSMGKDASWGSDNKGENLVRMKRHSHKSRGEIDSSGRKFGYRERDKDSKDARGLAKNRKHDAVEKSGSGWGLVERILEKKTFGRNGEHGRGCSEYGGSYSNLKDERSRLYKGFNGSQENLDGGHFERKKSGHSASQSKRWKNPQQNGREVRRADDFGVPDQSKDAFGHGSSDKFSDIKRVGNNSVTVGRKFRYGDNSTELYEEVEQTRTWARDHISSVRRKMDDHAINQSKDTHFHTSKVEKKIGGYENNKSLPERESSIRSSITRKSEESVVTENSYGSGRLYGTNMSKKSDGYESRKNMWKDEISSRMDQRKTQGNLRRSGTRILEKDTDYDEQNDIKRIGHGTNASKGDLYASAREIHGQGRNRSHVRFNSDTMETENFDSRAIEMWGRSGKYNLQSDKIAGREIVDFEDRAAFKTFEVFTDVRNRPRVLRMEMEERIQKLAKWLNATDVNMPEWQFSKMMHSAKIKFTDHSILRVVQILGALGNWKRVLQVVEWLHSRDRFKSFKSRYIYTTVLHVLGKAKRPIEALNIFYAMRQELSSYPDLAAYHCISVTLGQTGLMKELFDVMDCMRAAPEKKFKLGPLQRWDPRLEPDLVIYNAVLNACVQQKQWEGAFWVLQQLKQQGIQPTNTTYGLVMEVMLACGKYNLVHEFFRKVKKTSIPSTLNYKVLVNTLWREGKTDEAVLAVRDMERRGIVGSASLYYDLARCLCSAGRCQEALLQVDKICKVAKKPLVITYTGLIQACLDSGSIENGTYIFNQMHKFCFPNTITNNIMLKSYIQHGMFEEAKRLFQKVLADSHQIKSKVDSSQQVVPDKFTFNTMMEACAATNNWDDFENTYHQMLHHGFHFDTKRHLRMVLDAFRAGKRQVLEATWEHLVRFDRVPPPPIIQERFCIKLQEDKHADAISCIETHQGSEIRAFSEKSWLNLLETNAHRFKNDTIFRLVQELSNLSVGRDRQHPVYQNLLNACREFVVIYS